MAKDAEERLVELGEIWSKFFAHRLELLESGQMITSEVRDGKIVDTTKEEIDLSRQKHAEFSKLLRPSGE